MFSASAALFEIGIRRKKLFCGDLDKCFQLSDGGENRFRDAFNHIIR